MTNTPCPGDESLAAYVDGRLGGEEIARLSSHLIDCERCYASVAATVRFLAGGAHPGNVNDAPRWALLPALVTATVMAIVMTIGLLLLERGP